MIRGVGQLFGIVAMLLIVVAGVWLLYALTSAAVRWYGNNSLRRGRSDRIDP